MLKVHQVEKFYGKKQVLSDVTLSIPEGVCFGLVGPNGAGKTTLLKIISSIICDYAGEVQFTNPHVRIGYVPQEIAFEETLTAWDNLSFFGKLYGLSGKKLKIRIDEVLTAIGLENWAKDKVMTFSGGMKRRLNIGCALLHWPKLLIMDEPTVGIDPQSRQYIFEMIHRLKKEGCTIIYASHYMEEIEHLCDAAAFMDHGEIVETGTLSEIMEEHAAPAIFIKGDECLPNDIKSIGSVEQREGGYLVSTARPLDAMEKVLNFCKEKGSSLERLELVKPRLDDVFFALTGKQLRE